MEPTSDKKQADPESDGWSLLHDTGFIDLVGPLWTKQEDGVKRLALLADARHANRRGNVHGGMIATLLDRALGHHAVQFNESGAQATVQLDIHFIDAVQIGEFVEVRCQINRLTRNLIFLSGIAHVQDRTVAVANGIWRVLRMG